MALFKMLRGPEPGIEISLESEEIMIGRGSSNDIVIQDNEVSRRHCRLVRVLDDYELHDLGSTNGTFVNGQPVSAGGWLLSAHTLVELGDSITFEYLPADVATTTSAPQPEKRDKPMYLVVKQQSVDLPEIYLLDRGSITIGRDTNNDIIVVEPEVSRHHMRLIRTTANYALEDLNTLNGTYVNDRRLLSQRILHDSDMVRVGQRLKMWYTSDPDSLLDSIKAGQPVHKMIEDAQSSEGKTDLLAERDKSASSRLTEQVVDMGEKKKKSTSALGHGLSPNQLENHIFIAYARDDWLEIVVKLYEYLTTRGFAVWVDQYLIAGTQPWEEAIEQANLEAQCLLAVMTEKSLNTPYVKRSISRFVSRAKPVVLLQSGDVEHLPLIVDNTPAVSFNPDDPDKAFRSLLAELEKLNIHKGE